MIVGYARTSTKEQKLDLQRDEEGRTGDTSEA